MAGSVTGKCHFKY